MNSWAFIRRLYSFLLEHLYKRIKRPRDLEISLNIPVIGVIEKVEENFMIEEKLNSFVLENYRNLMINIDTVKFMERIKSLLITSLILMKGIV